MPEPQSSGIVMSVRELASRSGLVNTSMYCREGAGSLRMRGAAREIQEPGKRIVVLGLSRILFVMPSA